MLNVYVVARAMMDQFGDDAVQEAEKRAGDAKAHNDPELEQSWKEVAKVVVDAISRPLKVPR